MNENFTAVIDIGTTFITGAIGVRGANGNIHLKTIRRVKSEGVKRGVVINPLMVANKIKELARGLEKDVNAKILGFYVGTGGNPVFFQRNRVTRLLEKTDTVTKGLLDEMYQENNKIDVGDGNARLSIEEQGYWADKEPEAATTILGRVGSLVEGEYLILSMPQVNMENLRKAFKNADYEIMDFVVSPRILGETYLSQTEKNIGAAIIDMGAGSSKIAVYYDGRLRHLAVLPFGGNSVTNDIKEGLKILAEQAEDLKVKFGVVSPELVQENLIISVASSDGWEPREVQKSTLAHIINARVHEIVDNLANQIDLSGYFDKIGAGIVLVGGGSCINGLNWLTKGITGLNVRAVGLASNITIPERIVLKPGVEVAISLLNGGLDDCRKIVTVEKPQLEIPNDMKPQEKPGKKKGNGFITMLKGLFDEDENIK